MRPALPFLLASAAGLLFASMGACGGRVVVDGFAGSGGAGATGGQGGQGGQGGAPFTTSDGSTFSGPGCSFPPPVGKVISCNAAASSGPGMPVSCAEATCDDAHNQYFSSCNEQSCVCSYSPADGTESFGCTCSNNGACGSTAPNCCPFHF